ncbi:hypothetical protein LPJ56_000523 [Coemansia sp. RSA 2599]|nr:hypothetical protein LPJ56_000523 [Coemansia sp. RSA 2599]
MTVVLKNLSSAGTLVNAHKLSVGQQQILKSGDLISIAGRSLRYEAPKTNRHWTVVTPQPSASLDRRLVSTDVQPNRQLVFKSTAPAPATARRLSRRLHSSKAPRDPETAKKLKLWHQHYSDVMQEQENKATMGNNGQGPDDWPSGMDSLSVDILSEEPPEMLYNTSQVDLDSEKRDSDDVFGSRSSGQPGAGPILVRDISEVIEEPKPLRLLLPSPERSGDRVPARALRVPRDEGLQDEVARIMAEISRLAHGDSNATPERSTTKTERTLLPTSNDTSSGRGRRRRSRSLPRSLDDTALSVAAASDATSNGSDNGHASAAAMARGVVDQNMYPPLQPKRASEIARSRAEDVAAYGSEDETSRTTVGVSPTSSYSRSPTLMKQRQATSMQTPVKAAVGSSKARRNQTPAEFFSSLPRPPNAQAHARAQEQTLVQAQVSQSARAERGMGAETAASTSAPSTPTAGRGGLKRAMSSMAIGSSRMHKVFKTSSPLKRTVSSSNSSGGNGIDAQPIAIIRPSFVVGPANSVGNSSSGNVAPAAAAAAGYSSDEVPTEPEPDSDSDSDSDTDACRDRDIDIESGGTEEPAGNEEPAATAPAINDIQPAAGLQMVPNDHCLVTPKRVGMLARISSTTRKSVRFGPALSPEVFDSKAPPSTPLRRGTPMQIGRMSSILRQSADASLAMPLTPFPKAETVVLSKSRRQRSTSTSASASASASSGNEMKMGSSQAIQQLLQPKLSRRRLLNQYFSALSALDEGALVDSAHVVEVTAVGMEVDRNDGSEEKEECVSSDIAVIDGVSTKQSEFDGDEIAETSVNADTLVVVRPRRRSVRLARKDRRVTLDSVSQTHRAAMLGASPPASPLSPAASSPSLVVRTRNRPSSPAASPIAISSGLSKNKCTSGVGELLIKASDTSEQDQPRKESKERNNIRRERKERRRTAPVGFGRGSVVSSSGQQPGGPGNLEGLGDLGASIAAMAAALGEDVPTMLFSQQDKGSLGQRSNSKEKKNEKETEGKGSGKKCAGSGNLSESGEDSGVDDALPLADNLSPLNEHPPLGLADAMHMQLQLSEKSELDDLSAAGEPELREAAENPDSKAEGSPMSIRRGASSSELLLQEQARIQARIINPGTNGNGYVFGSADGALDEQQGTAEGIRRHRRRTAAVLETLALPAATAATTADSEVDADDLLARRQRLRRLQERKRRRQTVAELKKRRSSWLGWMPSGGSGSASNSPLRGASTAQAAANELSSPPRSPSPSPMPSSAGPVPVSAMAVPAQDSAVALGSAGTCGSRGARDGSRSRRWQNDFGGHASASVAASSKGRKDKAQDSSSGDGDGGGEPFVFFLPPHSTSNSNNNIAQHAMYPPESWNSKNSGEDASRGERAQQSPKKRRRLADYVASAFGRKAENEASTNAEAVAKTETDAPGGQHLYPPRPVAIDAEWEHIDGSLIPRNASSETNVGNSSVLPARMPEEPVMDNIDSTNSMGNGDDDYGYEPKRSSGEMHAISLASQRVELHAAAAAAEVDRDSDDPECEAQCMSASVSASTPRPLFTVPGSRVAARANRVRGLSSSTPSLLPTSKASANRISKPATAGVGRARSSASLSQSTGSAGRAGIKGAYARGAGGLGLLADSRKPRGTALATASALAPAPAPASASALTGASAAASLSAAANKDVHAQKRASATDARLDGGQRKALSSNNASGISAQSVQRPNREEDAGKEKKQRQPRAPGLRRKSTATVGTGDASEAPAALSPPSSSSSGSKNSKNSNKRDGTAGKRKSLAGDAIDDNNGGGVGAAGPSRRMTRSRAQSLAGGDAAAGGSSSRRKTMSAVSPARPPRQQPSKAPATARVSRRKK